MGFKAYLNEDFNTVKTKWLKDGYSLETINQYIDEFKELKNANQIQGQEKDIDYWIKSFDTFINFVGPKFVAYNEKKSKKEFKKLSADKVKTVFENKKCIVYVPLTSEASRKICSANGETGWCIASPSAKTAEHHWGVYIGKQGLTPYYVIDKKNEHNRFAVMVNPHNKISSIWDKEDQESMTYLNLIDEYGIPRDIFKSLATLPPEDKLEQLKITLYELKIFENLHDWNNYFDFYGNKTDYKSSEYRTNKKMKIKKNEMITGAIISDICKQILTLGDYSLNDLKEKFFEEIPSKCRTLNAGEKENITNNFFKKIESFLKNKSGDRTTTKKYILKGSE